MTLSLLYPIVYTSKFAQTVAYYEDHFDFIPVFEKDDVVVMKRNDCDHAQIAIVDRKSSMIPDAYKDVVGSVALSFAVDNVDLIYQELYWEGLEIEGEPKVSVCGERVFFVKDPNGVFISIIERGNKEKLLGAVS